MLKKCKVQNVNIKFKTYSSTSLLQLEKASSGNDCSLLNDKSLQKNEQQQQQKLRLARVGKLTELSLMIHIIIRIEIRQKYWTLNKN